MHESEQGAAKTSHDKNCNFSELDGYFATNLFLRVDCITVAHFTITYLSQTDRASAVHTTR